MHPILAEMVRTNTTHQLAVAEIDGNMPYGDAKNFALIVRDAGIRSALEQLNDGFRALKNKLGINSNFFDQSHMADDRLEVSVGALLGKEFKPVDATLVIVSHQNIPDNILNIKFLVSREAFGQQGRLDPARKVFQALGFDAVLTGEDTEKLKKRISGKDMNWIAQDIYADNVFRLPISQLAKHLSIPPDVFLNKINAARAKKAEELSHAPAHKAGFPVQMFWALTRELLGIEPEPAVARPYELSGVTPAAAHRL